MSATLAATSGYRRALATCSRNAAELGFLPALSDAPEAGTSHEVSPFLRRVAAFLGIDLRHLTAPGLDTAARGGSAVLSPFAADNPLPIVRAVISGGVCFAGAGITVRAGHRLRIDSPNRLPVTVIASRIVLEAGAVLEVSAETRIFADRFEGAGTAPNILIIGNNGRTGPPGNDGHIANAPGGRGGSGERGSIVDTFDFTVQEIKGYFLAETRGGSGGKGGPGGKGGKGRPPERGGLGGDGGDGGDTSAGCRIQVRYGVLAMDATFSLVSEPARPGDGGDGGKGGFGRPDGRRGQDGRAGNQSSLETIPLG